MPKLSAIVTLTVSGNTLGDIQDWLDKLEELSAPGPDSLKDAPLLDSCDFVFEDPAWADKVPALKTCSLPTVAQVRDWASRAKAAGVPAEAVVVGAELIAVDLHVHGIEFTSCGDHIGALPTGVVVFVHPLCASHE